MGAAAADSSLASPGRPRRAPGTEVVVEAFAGPGRRWNGMAWGPGRHMPCAATAACEPGRYATPRHQPTRIATLFWLAHRPSSLAVAERVTARTCLPGKALPCPAASPPLAWPRYNGLLLGTWLGSNGNAVLCYYKAGGARRNNQTSRSLKTSVSCLDDCGAGIHARNAILSPLIPCMSQLTCSCLLPDSPSRHRDRDQCRVPFPCPCRCRFPPDPMVGYLTAQLPDCRCAISRCRCCDVATAAAGCRWAAVPSLLHLHIRRLVLVACWYSCCCLPP